MSNENNQQIGHVDDSKDTLVQMNIRVKKSVAQSFRSFCELRRLTQSEGLRLLLMGEDFPNRDLIMKVYQQEMTEKDDEILCLREQNKELLEFQRGKESWVQHQRKEWIKIAKTMLDHLISQTAVRHGNAKVKTVKDSVTGEEKNYIYNDNTGEYESKDGKNFCLTGCTSSCRGTGFYYIDSLCRGSV